MNDAENNATPSDPAAEAQRLLAVAKGCVSERHEPATLGPASTG